MPISVAEELVGKKLSASSYQYWGYEGSERFATPLVIPHKDQIWEKVLENQTGVKEAAQTDRRTRHELRLALDLFCAYGIPITELSAWSSFTPE